MKQRLPILDNRFGQEPLSTLTSRVDPEGECLLAVGGCVRDALLNKDFSDMDFATSLTPKQVIEGATRAGFGVDLKGFEHGTVVVHRDGQAFEITSLRQDVETDGRHARIALTNDWTEDAKRRDFTVNALYYAPKTGLLDPLNGRDDLHPLTLKFVGNPEKRILEDSLRIFRFYRFWSQWPAVLIDPESLTWVEKLATSAPLPSRERITTEWMGMLRCEPPEELWTSLNKAGLGERVFGHVPAYVREAKFMETRLAISFAPAPEAMADALRLPGNIRRQVVELAQIRSAIINQDDHLLARRLLHAAKETITMVGRENVIFGHCLSLLTRLETARKIGAVEARAAGLEDGPEMGKWIRKARIDCLLGLN